MSVLNKLKYKFTRQLAFPFLITVLFLLLFSLLIYEMKSYDTLSDNSIDERIRVINDKLNEFIPETSLNNNNNQEEIAVLLLACDRVTVSKSLDSILAVRPPDSFPIVVSQDCANMETSKVIEGYTGKILHLRQPDTSPPLVENGHEYLAKYYSISRHYKWALKQVFDILKFQNVIIIEDDMEVSPDFFAYFQAFLPLLLHDETLYCISAWNDNGKKGIAHDPYAFYRTDFFPGLGWLLTKRIYQELKPKWPAAFWDDWMRESSQRKDRNCIRPEISRVSNFGRKGVSQGLFFDEHIAPVIKNTIIPNYVGYNGTNLMSKELVQGKNVGDVDVRLFVKEMYDSNFVNYINSLEVSNHVICPRCKGDYKVMYGLDKDLESLLRDNRLMDDKRAGQHRTEYLGVICFKNPIPFEKLVRIPNVCFVPSGGGKFN
jgi:alpha-1,3-mannosyl-glycoprotein beta-1,2-N-acetylglucosaminyltransferase